MTSTVASSSPTVEIPWQENVPANPVVVPRDLEPTAGRAIATGDHLRCRDGHREPGDGLRLLHVGAAADAATEFAAAAAKWLGFNAPRAVFCRWAEGEALRRAGELVAIEQRLSSALDAAIACEHEPAVLRIRRSMRQAGVRVPSAQPRPIAAGSGLTRRERELLALVGQGLTNAEIARRMGLGRPTVARILSNAMSKLGAGSRAQAVSLAVDLI